LGVLVVAIIIAEVALAIRVAATARRLRRTVPLATLAATVQASVAVPAPAIPAPIAAPARLAAIAPAAVAAEAVVVAPLAEVHALVAVVVALADKKYVNPYLNPIIKSISYEKVICNSCYCCGHYARSSTGNV
jgi:hypothetical protein